MKKKAKAKKDLLNELQSRHRKVNRRVKINRKMSGSQAKKITNCTEELIRQSEARLNRAELASKSGNWELHLDSQIMLFSEGANKIYGISNGLFNYKILQKNTLPEYRPLLNSAINNLIENNQPYDLEYKIKTSDTGEIKDIHSIAEFDKKRKIIFGVIQDITSRKQMEDILRESEDRYRSIFKNSIGAIFLTRPGGQILAANPEACRIFGRTEEELCLLGRESVVDITDPRLAVSLEERARTGKFKGELTFIRKDGTKFPGLLATNIFLDKEGKELTSMVVYDITDQKHVEEALRESEERFRAIYNASPSAISISEIETGKLIEINEAYEKLLGYTKDESIGKSSVELGIWINKDNRKTLIDIILTKGVYNNLEVNFKTKNGSIIDCLLSGRIIFIKNKKFMIAILHNITDLQNATLAIKESEERFRKIFEEHSAVKLLIDPGTGNIVDANKAAAEYYGWAKEELLKMNINEINTLSPQEIKCEMEKAGSRAKTHFEFRHCLKNGSIRDVEVFSSKVAIGGKEYLHSIVHDIGDRKLAEDKLKKYSLELKELNERKDKLFSIIAHDLKGPFSPLLGLTEILVNDFESLTTEEIIKYNNQIYDSLKKEYTLLENLLNWSRLETKQMEFKAEKMNLYDKTESVINLLSGNAKLKNIALVNGTDKDVFILADPNMLHSVLQNLIANSIKFTNKDGLIKIYSENLSNGFVQITVSDNGIGMTNDQKKDLFGLTAISTQGTNNEKGTGLGLIICKEMIERQGGTISVKSEVGKGTDIYFTLPKAE